MVALSRVSESKPDEEGIHEGGKLVKVSESKLGEEGFRMGA